jgi:predicted TIM-barrel enzyme
MKYNPLSQVVDEPLQISDETVEKLSAFLQREPKLPLLPGVDVTDERARLSKIVNDLTDRIVAGIRAHPTKLWVLSEFQKALELIEEEETEGREHFGLELERIMDILDIESSDGLLAFYLSGI